MLLPSPGGVVGKGGGEGIIQSGESGERRGVGWCYREWEEEGCCHLEYYQLIPSV